MNLVRLDPAEAWPTAGPLIAAALARSDETAEEVLQKCRSGEAWLLATDQAVAVVEPMANPVGFDLLIWVAATRGARDCIPAHLPALEQLARDMGARCLAFRTSRRGFERVMPEGWRIRQVTWAKEL